MTRETWFVDALCRDINNAELFFPRSNSGGRPSREELTAIAVCRRCPVQQQCLDYALQHHCDYGIWGGTTGSQRYTMRRSQ